VPHARAKFFPREYWMDRSFLLRKTFTDPSPPLFWTLFWKVFFTKVVLFRISASFFGRFFSGLFGRVLMCSPPPPKTFPQGFLQGWFRGLFCPFFPVSKRRRLRIFLPCRLRFFSAANFGGFFFPILRSDFFFRCRRHGPSPWGKYSALFPPFLFPLTPS